MVITILTGIFAMSNVVWDYIAYSALAGFVIAGVIYFAVKKFKGNIENDS